MTPDQIELARHALGLPNADNKSYRNYFCAGPGHSDFSHWTEMVSAGDAVTEKRDGFGGDHLFWLTLSGAKKATRDGEVIDASDFPEILRK